MQSEENSSFNNYYSSFDDNRVKLCKSASKKPNRKLEIEIRKSTLIIRYLLFIRNRPDDLIPRFTIFFSSCCRPLASLQLPAFMTLKINLTLYPANTYVIFRSQNLPVSSIFYPSSSNVFRAFPLFILSFALFSPHLPSSAIQLSSVFIMKLFCVIRVNNGCFQRCVLKKQTQSNPSPKQTMLRLSTSRYLLQKTAAVWYIMTK